MSIGCKLKFKRRNAPLPACPTRLCVFRPSFCICLPLSPSLSIHLSVRVCFIWAQRRAFKLVREKWEWSGLRSRRLSHKKKEGTLNPCHAPVSTRLLHKHLRFDLSLAICMCTKAAAAFRELLLWPDIPGQLIRATCGQFSQLLLASNRCLNAPHVRLQSSPESKERGIPRLHCQLDWVRWIDCTRICTDLAPLNSYASTDATLREDKQGKGYLRDKNKRRNMKVKREWKLKLSWESVFISQIY